MGESCIPDWKVLSGGVKERLKSIEINEIMIINKMFHFKVNAGKSDFI